MDWKWKPFCDGLAANLSLGRSRLLSIWLDLFILFPKTAGRGLTSGALALSRARVLSALLWLWETFRLRTLFGLRPADWVGGGTLEAGCFCLRGTDRDGRGRRPLSQLREYTLEYDLWSLPTLQHRCGLGGLVVLLEFLRAGEVDGRPEFELGPGSLRLSLTPDSLLCLFNLLYEGLLVARVRGSKPRGEYEEFRDDSGRKLFRYSTERPAGRWLFEGYKGGAEEAVAQGLDPWHELWQDSLWLTFRGIPATRKIYQAQANRARLAEEFWEKFGQSSVGEPVIQDIASTIYVGAQAKSAEGLEFEGTPEEVLLLHFAHALAQPYTVMTVDSQGGVEWPGWAWVFPEPSDLVRFVQRWPERMSWKPSYDPNFKRRSRVCAPVEGALFCLHQEAQGFEGSSLQGAFCTHLQKVGNNIHLRASSYLPYDEILLREYRERVRPLKSFPLRALMIKNLLAGEPLTRGVARLMSRLPLEQCLPFDNYGMTFSTDSRRLLENLPSCWSERTLQR